MSVKGEWKRRVDFRYEKEAEVNKEKLFGGRCRLPHEHDDKCQPKKEKK